MRSRRLRAPTNGHSDLAELEADDVDEDRRDGQPEDLFRAIYIGSCMHKCRPNRPSTFLSGTGPLCCGVLQRAMVAHVATRRSNVDCSVQRRGASRCVVALQRTRRVAVG